MLSDLENKQSNHCNIFTFKFPIWSLQCTQIITL